MKEICVVHLVRAKNGGGPFKAFLESYARNPGGVEHDLLIVYKGFRGKSSVVEHERLSESFPHRAIFLRDVGFDIRAYLVAAETFDYTYFCFLNSFSVLSDTEWLGKMHSHISRKGVGLVGATGSHESLYSNLLSQGRKLPAYKKAFLFPATLLYKRCFDPTPNYHIRTNAFMVSSAILRSVCRPFVATKFDAHRFESGKESLTKQIMNRNLDALVVGRDGIGYGKERWRASRTFRSGEQENLLVKDNKTMEYANGDPETRRRLAEAAWGPPEWYP